MDIHFLKQQHEQLQLGMQQIEEKLGELLRQKQRQIGAIQMIEVLIRAEGEEMKRFVTMLLAMWLMAMPAQSLAQSPTLTAEIQSIHIRDDGSRSPYSTITITVNEPEAVYTYTSFAGFGDGEQVDFQPSGSGWRTVLMCCDLVEPIVYVWTRDNDGNVLSTWTNAVLANQVFLPVVVR